MLKGGSGKVLSVKKTSPIPSVHIPRVCTTETSFSISAMIVAATRIQSTKIRIAPAIAKGIDHLKYKSKASMTNGAIHNLLLITSGMNAIEDKEKANVAINDTVEEIRTNFQ